MFSDSGANDVNVCSCCRVTEAAGKEKDMKTQIYEPNMTDDGVKKELHRFSLFPGVWEALQHV